MEVLGRMTAELPKEPVAAALEVGVECHVGRELGLDPPLGQGVADRIDRGGCDVVMTDRAGRRLGAAAHAGRTHHPHLRRIQSVAEVGKKPLPAEHGAGEAVADADGDGRGRRLAFLHDVEMGVEGGRLENLGLRQAQLLGQRPDVGGREVAERLLEAMEMLDQKITTTRHRAEHGLDLLERLGIELAPLGHRPAPSPLSPALRRAVLGHRHCKTSA